MDFEKILALLKAMHSEGVEYVLVGAIALTVHGIVRATQDVDLFVKPEDLNIDRLRTALKSVFPDDPSIQEILSTELKGEYPVIRYVSPDGSLVLDILSRLGTMFCYETIQYENKEYAGVQVRVATPGMLYEIMKKGTLRPQDRADAAALREAFHLTG